ncbi:MAG: pyridoxamine 5'-phosphate oxidase family protein [Hyphomicrobiales bacterium]
MERSAHGAVGLLKIIKMRFNMSLFSQESPGKDNQDRLWSLLGDHNTFMLVTKSSARHSTPVRARPMAGYPRRDEQRIWFLAHKDGVKDDEIEMNSQVCVTLSDASKQHFVSIRGKASVKHDLARKRDLWSVAAQAWFPDGPEDPNIVLLCVDVEKAEFWDGDPNPIIVAFKMARAVAEGRDVEVGEHGKVSFERYPTGRPTSLPFTASY